MVNLAIGFAMFLAVISGTSKGLLISASAFILLSSLLYLIRSGFKFKIPHSRNTVFLIFTICLLSSFFLLPIENIEKLFLTIISIFLSAIIVKIAENNERSGSLIYSMVIGIILFGDALHFSGLLGTDMNAYKSIVQFQELSNLERENEIGILGLRYHGWFAEPSYHGAFSGVLTALLWNQGQRVKSGMMAFVLFVFCPTPMMILGFGAGVLFSNKNWLLTLFKRPAVPVVAFTLLGLFLAIIFANRFVALSGAISEVAGGGYVNNSEAIRIVYPVVALLDHFMNYGIQPASINCIEQNICLSESAKFPLITFFIFFGFIGLLLIGILISWLNNAGSMRVFLALLISSVLSGGAGFVLQYGLIVTLLMHRSRQIKHTGN